MQTYTHLGIGLMLGQVFFPDDTYSQALVVGTIIAIDGPSGLEYLLDILQHKKPLEGERKVLLNLTNISHSFFLWMSSVLISWPVFVGAYSHLFIDWISHKGEKFRETDPTMIWPLPWKLRGIFEYRKEAGKLLSPLEIALTILSVLIFITLRFLG